jgi:hypothetical protein
MRDEAGTMRGPVVTSLDTGANVRLFFSGVALAVALSRANAQGVAVKEDKPGLLRKAKITAEAATASARAKVPNGKIVAAEIEEEKGRLIYSFDIRTDGKPGIDEVNVDAITGKVLGVEHETPKDEAKEKAADKKAGATRKP